MRLNAPMLKDNDADGRVSSEETRRLPLFLVAAIVSGVAAARARPAGDIVTTPAKINSGREVGHGGKSGHGDVPREGIW